MTWAAWMLIIGCGVCLALAVGMAVVAARIGGKYRRVQRELESKTWEVIDAKTNLADMAVRLKAAMTKSDPRNNMYLIREEEYA